MLQVILSYLPYGIITSFTPGPNNIMSLYSVSSAGWKKGGRLIFGIFAGFSTLTLLVILFCHELAKYVPELVKYLKYVGAVYILWLAVHIARSTPGESQRRAINFRSGYFLSLTNVKVILYLITIYMAYIIPSGASLLEMIAHGVFIIAVSAVSWCLWGAAGGMMQKFLTKYYRPFNIAMGIILAWCAVQILMQQSALIKKFSGNVCGFHLQNFGLVIHRGHVRIADCSGQFLEDTFKLRITFQHSRPDYVSAQVRRVKILVVVKQQQILVVNLRVSRESNKHVNISLSQRLILQPNVDVDRVSELEAVS